MPVSEETDLSLQEVSRMTVRVKKDRHKIAKITSEFDLEQDRENLVAIPLPGILSTAESLERDIQNLRQSFEQAQRSNDEKLERALVAQHSELENSFKEQRSELENSFKDQLESALINQRSELEYSFKEQLNLERSELDSFKGQLKLERSTNSYYFGVLTTIRIWAKVLYERVEKEEEEKEKEKEKEEEEEEKKHKPFGQFFRDFIYSCRETLIKKKMRDSLKLSPDDINLIRSLTLRRNIHAHGEREFFAALGSKNPDAIKEAFELLRESMENAQYYEEQDIRIVEIASTFLQNIREDLLNQNLLIE